MGRLSSVTTAPDVALLCTETQDLIADKLAEEVCEAESEHAQLGSTTAADGTASPASSGRESGDNSDCCSSCLNTWNTIHQAYQS